MQEESKYDVRDIKLSSILNYIENDEIKIPEIQRPFVWDSTKVRDLIDSLYKGYPVGYIIVSQNPNLKLKGGGEVEGKKILIDGQQRITALKAALMGSKVVGESFEEKSITISFNPFPEPNKDSMFEVQGSKTKNKRWIADISVLFNSDFSSRRFIKEYHAQNAELSEVELDELERRIKKLIQIKEQQIGVIELHKDLSVDDVTEIFVRINRQGAKLNQTDFVMSKMAANEKFGGNTLRKAIDYFSHLALQPDWYSEMCNDKDFMGTSYASKLKWLKDDKEEVFDPDYNDIIRTVFMHKFDRAKIKDLVSLLEGRDFEARENREEIAEQTFILMSDGVLDFMTEYSFTNFVLAIKSAGFIAKKLINSSATLDFAYMLYLRLNSDPSIDKASIKHYVMRWFVLTTLTGRYSSSSETIMEQDIRRIKEIGFAQFLADIEAAELSEAFWTTGLVQSLETSVISSPYFNVFIAAQVFFGDSSLFLNGSKISDLITIIGDVHHIFPKKYLIRNGIEQRTKYNQIANFTYLDTQVNKAVGDDAPNIYFKKALNGCEEWKAVYGNISDTETLKANLSENCIPEAVIEMDFSDYDTFLAERRKLMAQKIRKYYYSL